MIKTVEVADSAQGGLGWLNARKLRITASEVAAILGESPFATPLSIWLGKQPEAEPITSNNNMWWGSMNERNILDRYGLDTGTIVDGGGGLLVREDEPWLGASVDGFSYHKADPNPVVVEAKWAVNHSGWDMPPAHYWAQVQIQLFVCDLPFGVIAAAFARNQFEVFPVLRDDEWLDATIPYLRDWHSVYVSGREQPPETLPEDAPKLIELTKPDPSKSMEIEPGLWEQYVALAESHRKLTKELDAVKKDVKLQAGSATSLLVDGAEVATYRGFTSTGVDIAALKNDGIYEKYSKQREVRTLRLKKGKSK